MFDPVLDLPATIETLVREGSQMLEKLHEYMQEVVPLVRHVEENTWLLPDGADELAAVLKRCVGFDALEDLLMAMFGLVEEGTVGEPTNEEYVRVLERYGYLPIRSSDGSGRGGNLSTDELEALGGDAEAQR